MFEAESSEVSPHTPEKDFSVHTDIGIDKGKTADKGTIPDGTI